MTRGRKNIRFTFGISLVILLISSAASYISINNLLDSERWVDHTFQVKERLDFVISRMKDAETGQRGYLLTNDKDFLQPYTGSEQEVSAAVDQAETLTSDNGAQQKDFPKLRSLIAHKYRIINGTIKGKQQGALLSGEVIVEGKHVMDSIRNQIKIMERREDALLKQRQSAMNTLVSYTPYLVITGALISMLLAIYFYKRIAADVKENSRLQEQLRKKEADTEKQIELIRNAAESIAKGNYDKRIDEV